MKETSKFQLIVYIVCVVAVIGAVVVLATYRAKSSKNNLRAVTIWGTMPASEFGPFLTVATNQTSIAGSYHYHDPSTIGNDLLEALASGKAPDILFLTDDQLFAVRKRIAIMPFSVYPQRTFLSNFIEGTEIFMDPQGVEAFPALVDPMVMYWNRSILTAAGYVAPPTTWDQFYALASQISQHDASLNITQSAVALGAYDNINNAKDILHTLMYQAGGGGDPQSAWNITVRNGLNFTSDLSTTPTGSSINPAASALDFYMQFSDPLKPTYSWNQTLSSAQDEFISGNLAIYFGYASEINQIRAKNPNLDFDVALMPQTKGDPVPMTHGSFYSFSIVNTSALQDGVALADINTLTSAPAIARVVGQDTYFPVRRDMITAPQSNADKAVFYKSALYSDTWIDPDPAQVDTIFGQLINMISSGRLTTTEAVGRADTQIGALLK